MNWKSSVLLCNPGDDDHCMVCRFLNREDALTDEAAMATIRQLDHSLAKAEQVNRHLVEMVSRLTQKLKSYES